MTRNQKIKWVMRKAWQLAKTAVPVHGGKVREYLAASIRMAWAMLRQGMNIVPTSSAAVAVYHRDQVAAETAAVSKASFSSETAASNSFDDGGVDMTTIDVIQVPVFSVVAKKSTDFFGKIAKAARQAIAAVEDFLIGAVHIEL